MSNSKVFAIEEFSTFDGPGIRTTVFLKGCPLRCTWCHNPEGQSFFVEYMRNTNGCIGCGECLKYAEKKNDTVKLTSESAEHCPKGLIRRSGDEYAPEKLAARILKNRKILDSTGGGVTFSGGEPLSHISFIEECVKNLDSLSVALQTSGYASEKIFEKALSLCDYVLYDLKIFEKNAHTKYCGVDNESILRNYETLSKSGKKFITRIPLIPEVTDTKENIESLAGFIKRCGIGKVELLPYNRFAGSKYISLLRMDVPKYEMNVEAPQAELINIFEDYGIEARMM